MSDPSPRGVTARTIGLGSSLVLLIAAFGLDYATGNEVSSSLFYLIGIAVASWFSGRRAGVLLAGLSTLAWGLAVHLVGPVFSKPSVFYWNLGAEMAIYLLAALTLGSLRLARERDLRNIEQLTLIREALDRELEAVGDLQREMLPGRLPALPGYAWDVEYRTSTQSGGDYYDFFPLPDGRLAFIVSDAAGHGPQAAVLMAMLRVLLHSSTGTMPTPEAVMTRISEQLERTVPAGRFATACFAVLDPGPGIARYSLAGHPAPYVVRAADGSVEELDMRGGPPLGLLPDATYGAAGFTLEAGDTLVVFTDGITECMNPRREQFGETRLRDALAGGHALSLEALRERVMRRLESYGAGMEAGDDRTLLLLRRTAPDG